jgi:uncharacterized lipoprotein NlpE involved in copper resistance
MKKIFFTIGALVTLMACNNAANKTATDVTSKTSSVDLPVPVAYKGTVALGNNENIVTVMKWNTHMIAGRVDSAGALIADSMFVNLADGSSFSLSHDSAVAMLKGWRTGMDSANQKYVAAIAVDNTTAGDQWVIQWTDETYYRAGGKNEHVLLSENYLLKNGKIRQVNQYARAVAAKK